MTKNINYEDISEIIVTTQEELDMVPTKFKGRIYIKNDKRIIVVNSHLQNVVARDNSSVVARGNSSVEARDNSSVEAWGNSSVVARDNSSVEAWGNTQIIDRTFGAKIKISGNARIVYMPKNINDFINFYGIKHTKTKAVFYKAVHKTNKENVFRSDYLNSFLYCVGETVEVTDCDQNTSITCGRGIHISHLNWALNFGAAWKDLAIIECETKISDIVTPENTDGKVRTSKIKVLREVPLEECGIYGKILAERNRINN